MTDRPAPNVLIVCKDLLFSSQLNGAVQRAELIPQTCLGMKTTIEALQRGGILYTIVDLELPELDFAELRNAAKGRVIGFGPHVHTALFEQAAACGFDAVLTRGQAVREMTDLLAQWQK